MAKQFGPIFIVGPSRSGTELTRQILNRHSEICIAPETHYFDDLRPRIGGGRSPLNGSGRSRALAYFEALRSHAYGLHGRAAAEHDPESGGRLTPAPATGDDLFAAYCEDFASETGKSIWGEKTPRHIFRCDDMLEAFPAAKVVVLLRDPRAVTASYRDWKDRWFAPGEADAALQGLIAREEARVQASYSLTTIALLWVSAARQARRLVARHGGQRVRQVRFEDILDAPEDTIRELANWLGGAFEPAMLKVDILNSSYLDKTVGGGIDGSVSHRWRTALSVDEIAYVERLAGRTAFSFGYVSTSSRLRLSFLLAELVGTPFAMLRATLANRERIGALWPYLAARLGGLVGR